MSKENDKLLARLEEQQKQINELMNKKETVKKEDPSGMSYISDGEKVQRMRTRIIHEANENIKKLNKIQAEYDVKNRKALTLFTEKFLKTVKEQRQCQLKGKEFKGIDPSISAQREVLSKYPELTPLDYPDHKENLEIKQEGGPSGVIYLFRKGYSTYVYVQDYSEIKGKLGISKMIKPSIPEINITTNNNVSTRPYNDSNMPEFSKNSINVTKNPQEAQKAFQQLQNNIRAKENK